MSSTLYPGLASGTPDNSGNYQYVAQTMTITDGLVNFERTCPLDAVTGTRVAGGWHSSNDPGGSSNPTCSAWVNYTTTGFSLTDKNGVAHNNLLQSDYSFHTKQTLTDPGLTFGTPDNSGNYQYVVQTMTTTDGLVDFARTCPLDAVSGTLVNGLGWHSSNDPGGSSNPTCSAWVNYTTNGFTLSVPIADTPTQVPATDTPTGIPPTGTPTLTPTETPIPDTTLSIEASTSATGISLIGIGDAPSGGNPFPKTTSRNVLVCFYDTSSAITATDDCTSQTTVALYAKTGTLQYDSPSHTFITGTTPIDISGVPTGNYKLFIKVQGYLRKQILITQQNSSTPSQIISITAFQPNLIANLSGAQLIPGDINGDNKVDIADYAILTKPECWEKPANTDGCQNADYDDDGMINEADYNLLIRGLTKVYGD